MAMSCDWSPLKSPTTNGTGAEAAGAAASPKIRLTTACRSAGLGGATSCTTAGADGSGGATRAGGISLRSEGGEGEQAAARQTASVKATSPAACPLPFMRTVLERQYERDQVGPLRGRQGVEVVACGGGLAGVALDGFGDGDGAAVVH